VHVIKAFVIDEAVDLGAFAEFRSFSSLVFLHATREIVRDPNVKSLGTVCQDVNVVIAVVTGMHRSFALLRMTDLRN
jgi:hypothetical protein